VETIERAARTGSIADGKIFVIKMEEVGGAPQSQVEDRDRPQMITYLTKRRILGLICMRSNQKNAEGREVDSIR
jgi:hypothetical protein